LLQVSAIDVGTSLDGITQAQRVEGANHYLLEFVRGVGHSLENFEFGEFEQVSIAGLPAARVHWTATASGQAAVGIIYCVLVGHSVVSLQTRDTGTQITPAMYSAMSGEAACCRSPAERIRYCNGNSVPFVSSIGSGRVGSGAHVGYGPRSGDEAGVDRL
jgi:hypothetical protein